MRIGYCKLGRSMPLSQAKWGVVGGDDEPPLLLKTLAQSMPEHEFVLVGRNSGEDPSSLGFPPNVTNGWAAIRDDIKRDFDRMDAPSDLSYDAVQHILDVFNLHMIPQFQSLDGLIVWTGQHGTSNSPIPKLGNTWDGELTTPQKAFVLYASCIIRGINAWRDVDPINHDEIWLCPDPRNYVKCRDLKWPIRKPVLAQFDFTRADKHERYGDPRTPAEVNCDARVLDAHRWYAPQRYEYSQLEICGVLPEHVPAWFGDNYHERDRFGIFINEARAYVARNRLDALRDYVLPLKPDFVHGKWSDTSLKTLRELGYDVQPAPSDVYYDKLRSVKSTFTTPSSGSGWATTKPWQAFATGTVCFFHPAYDTQGHIIPTLDQLRDNPDAYDPDVVSLARWLRVRNPRQLEQRVEAVAENEPTWRWLARAQRDLYNQACGNPLIVQKIKERLGVE